MNISYMYHKTHPEGNLAQREDKGTDWMEGNGHNQTMPTSQQKLDEWDGFSPRASRGSTTWQTVLPQGYQLGTSVP